MSSSLLELEFGDGAYLFALKLPQILELQRVCGAGIFAIYGRVFAGRRWIYDPVDQQQVRFTAPLEGQAFANDIYDTVRLGLIGGGKGVVNGEEVPVSPLRARQLVETYCLPPIPMKEVWDIAASILYATIEGYEGQKKSPEPAKAKPRRKGPTGSTKPKS